MRKISVALAALLTGGLAVGLGTALPASAATPVALKAPGQAENSDSETQRIEILRLVTARKDLARDKQLSGWLDELGSFYAEPANAPMWISRTGLTPSAGSLMEELGRAEDWGLEASDYDVPSAYGALTTAQQRAAAELDLSLAALTYAFHANGGRFDPTDLSLWYDMRPKAVPASKMLKTMANGADAGGVLRGLHPTHPQFVALREAYLDIIKPNRNTSTETVAAEPEPEDIYFERGPSIRRGDRHPQVALLRKRLNVPAEFAEDDTLYDREMMNAVNAYMRTQGWRRKHVFDHKVRAKLNAQAKGDDNTTGGKISKKALLVNMEKWRWMPREYGNFYIWNNLPSYRTEVRRDGDVIHSERIIIGKTHTQTPVFNDTMTHIVFKPEWGVPSSIKIKSLLPRLASGDYDVLRRRGMRVALNGRSGDPRRINWAKRDIRYIPIVQGPGASNPLGRMKFMFPNKHAVYMHDTPKKHLFNTRTRTHSAGCIRVRDPQQFAEILARETLGWSADDVAAMLSRRAKSNQRVDFDKPVPVYNTYFTVVADENGKLKSYSDVYGHDKRIGQALNGKSLKLIARNDPARIHKAKMEHLADNIPVVRPRYAENAWGDAYGQPPSYAFGNGGFWNQPSKPSKKSKKKYKPQKLYGSTMVRAFWETD